MTVTMTNHKNTWKTFLNRLVNCEALWNWRHFWKLSSSILTILVAWTAFEILAMFSKHLPYRSCGIVYSHYTIVYREYLIPLYIYREIKDSPAHNTGGLFIPLYTVLPSQAKSLEWSPINLYFWYYNIFRDFYSYWYWTSVQRLLSSKMVP